MLMTMRDELRGGITLILLLSICCTAGAIPPLPCEFYGSVTIDSTPAAAGAMITAFINGEERGEIATITPGHYGGSGVFDQRLRVEGREEDIGRTITFTVNGNPTIQTAIFNAGESRELHLAAITTQKDLPFGPDTVYRMAVGLSPIDMQADVNKDLRVDGADGAMIQYYLLGKISEL
jgi:hypothetical protein